MKIHQKIFTITIIMFCIGTINGLTAIPMKVSVQSGDTLTFCPFLKKWDTTVTSATIEVSAAKHGTVRVVNNWFDTNSFYLRIGTSGGKSRMANAPKFYPGFTYIPAEGFTGRDTFTYRVTTNLTTTENVICEVRVTPSEPGNMTVLIVVNQTLLTSIQTEVNRLKSDLENEGYKARICPFNTPAPWNVTHAKQLWDTLTAEYNKRDNMLTGSIMIGKLPYFGGPGDQVINRTSAFWCMTKWEPEFSTDSIIGHLVGFGGYSGYHFTPGFTNIWISYMNALSGWGNELTSDIGSEVTLVKRMLQNNHDFRTGASRLPRTAFYYNMYSKSAPMDYNKLNEIWPDTRKHGISDKTNPIDYEFKLGGEFFTANTHGNGDMYRSLYDGAGNEIWVFRNNDVSNTIVSTRFIFGENCHTGVFGTITNRFLLSKNSGCVLAVSASDYVGLGFHLEDSSSDAAPRYKARKYLGSGSSFGRAWLRANGAIWSANFHGDLSLKPNMTPANIKPIISEITAERVNGMSWKFKATATDADDGISGYDWYGTSYNRGKTDPDSSGTSFTFSKTYTEAKICTVRIEAVDHYKARDYASVIIKTDSGVIAYKGLTGTELHKKTALKTASASILPNPFTPRTIIDLGTQVASDEKVSLEVFAIDGRLIHRQSFTPGTRSTVWNCKNASAGIYIFKIRRGRIVTEIKGILSR
ncbi:MAG: hypothetical protein JNL74_06645 [Fibrobacteres bacterium]|nr:hypothetical protein [Fibrobacterota bacterium]